MMKNTPVTTAIITSSAVMVMVLCIGAKLMARINPPRKINERNPPKLSTGFSVSLILEGMNL